MGSPWILPMRVFSLNPFITPIHSNLPECGTLRQSFRKYNSHSKV